MGRLIWFALFAFAAWYGWNHKDSLNRAQGDEIVVVNHAGAAVERVRIGVGSDVVVFESVEDGTEQRRPWHGRSQGPFAVTWNLRGRLGELNWNGEGYQPSGTAFVHRFEFQTNARSLAQRSAPGPLKRPHR